MNCELSQFGHLAKKRPVRNVSGSARRGSRSCGRVSRRSTATTSDPGAATTVRDKDEEMNAAPRLSIGLAVYNGENYLAGSLEALLGQSYEDFELIISDNASTDGTAGICRRYLNQDSRIRYICQPRNIGAAPNHNFVVGQARGELFKWASHDDLYARDLLKCCVDALDEHPHIVLAHSWTALVDGSGCVTQKIEYPLATAARRAPERFQSMLYANAGDDSCGVVRTK